MSLAAGHMPHRMTVTEPDPNAEPDIWGNRPQKVTPNVPCRVDYGNRLIRNAAGEQVTSRAQIITCYKVTVGALITLEDGTNQPAIDVRPVSGLGGKEDHREVYL